MNQFGIHSIILILGIFANYQKRQNLSLFIMKQYHWIGQNTMGYVILFL